MDRDELDRVADEARRHYQEALVRTLQMGRYAILIQANETAEEFSRCLNQLGISSEFADELIDATRRVAESQEDINWDSPTIPESMRDELGELAVRLTEAFVERRRA